jgi:hypothetical protein
MRGVSQWELTRARALTPRSSRATRMDEKIRGAGRLPARYLCEDRQPESFIEAAHELFENATQEHIDEVGLYLPPALAVSAPHHSNVAWNSFEFRKAAIHTDH